MDDTQAGISQATFEEKQYEDQSWEVIGELQETHEFIPMEIEQLRTRAMVSDPMFADYGGIPESSAEQRWHLPEGEAGVVAVGPNGENIAAAAASVSEEEVQAQREAEIEAARSAAFEEGKQAGLQEAVERQNERLGQIEESLKSVFGDLKQQLDEMVDMHAKASLDISLQIANKLVEQAVEINPEYILPIIQEALSKVGTARIDRVRVSNQDLEFIEVVGVRKTLEEFDGSWDFVGDEGIRSGCIVDTSAGEVDYQLDQAWERIRDEVMRIAK